MTKRESLKLFEDKKVRTVWDCEQEKWYFSIVDVVEALTGSTDPKQYLKKMKSRDPELKSNWGTICTLIQMTGADGKKRRASAADARGVFRIIQSIPSPKAEPFKQWMAMVASQRLDQMQDPELSINQALQDYKRLGYSDNWINQRLKSIEVRKALTDEWQRGGITDQMMYASLTNIMTKEWSGKTVKEYKTYKGLKKESLRDNMTNIELALNTLAEASATELSQKSNPNGFKENAKVAKGGGSVAKAARNQLEKQLGRSVITRHKASDYILPKGKDEEQLLE